MCEHFNLLPEVYQKCGKMDRFAGKEPRFFIPFRLDKETNGQPPQEREEMMDTDPIDPKNSDPINPLSTDEIEVYEVILSSPEPEGLEAKIPSPVTVNLDTCRSSLLAAIYKRGRFTVSSSCSHESCSAYIAVKLGAMEAAQDGPAGQSTSNPIKESESEKIFVFSKVVHTASSIPVPVEPLVPMDITAAKSLGTSRHEVNNLLNFGRNDSISSDEEFEFSPAYEHRSIVWKPIQST